MIYFNTDISMSLGEDIYAALRSGRFPHSVIIEGGSHSNRLSLAKGIAQALVCSSQEAPCGTCSHCKKAASGIHPDIELYTEDKKGNFAADTSRAVVNSVSIIPNEADSKVYILSVTGQMSPVSQNILLKSLEEPPAYAFFIIVCPSRADLLDTVISRSRVFSLGEQENEPDEDAAQEALKTACGIAKATVSGKEFDIVREAAVFEKNKALFADVMPLLGEIFVEAMKVKATGEKSDRFDGAANVLAARLTLARLDELEKHTRQLKYGFENNRNYNLLITRLCTLFRANS